MIGNAIAGWIGNRIDRRDGEGGTLGALAGVLTWKATKRIVPHCDRARRGRLWRPQIQAQSSNPPV
jgi:hypothetical protein